MKAFLSAIVALAVIGSATFAILNGQQVTSEDKFTTPFVRLPAGH